MREQGYYWVKDVKGEWFIAEYRSQGDWWFICGDELDYPESTFTEIGERITRR